MSETGGDSDEPSRSWCALAEDSIWDFVAESVSNSRCLKDLRGVGGDMFLVVSSLKLVYAPGSESCPES
jgi:hypothetical protein